MALQHHTHAGDDLQLVQRHGLYIEAVSRNPHCDFCDPFPGRLQMDKAANKARARSNSPLFSIAHCLAHHVLPRLQTKDFRTSKQKSLSRFIKPLCQVFCSCLTWTNRKCKNDDRNICPTARKYFVRMPLGDPGAPKQPCTCPSVVYEYAWMKC
jgi:hypothetical protein